MIANANDNTKYRPFKKTPRRAQSSPIVLKRRTIYNLPGKAGLGLALALSIMLLGSMNTANQ